MILDHALFLYGFDVTSFNGYLNFKASSGGSVLTATLHIGNYTLSELADEIQLQMQAADPANTYTVTVDRTLSGGRSNQVTIQTSGAFLSLLFGTGPNGGNQIGTLLGFDPADYTGSTQYTGSTNAGTLLIPDLATYNYIGPDEYVTNDGNKNVSSSGLKETLVYAQMYFMQGQWKYITNQFGNTQKTQWSNFLKYATRQRKFEFTPSFEEDANTFYQVTLETTSADSSNGMAFTLQPMLDVGLYRFYDSGILLLRKIPD